MTQYEQSLKEKWDWYSSMKTARDEGKDEGIKEGEEKGIKKGKQEGKQDGLKEVAKNLKAEGESVPYIAKVTGFTEEEIKKL